MAVAKTALVVVAGGGVMALIGYVLQFAVVGATSVGFGAAWGAYFLLTSLPARSASTCTFHSR